MKTTKHFEERLLERTGFKVGTIRKEIELGNYRLIENEGIRRYPYLMRKAVNNGTETFVYITTLNLVIPVKEGFAVTCYVERLKRRRSF